MLSGEKVLLVLKNIQNPYTDSGIFHGFFRFPSDTIGKCQKWHHKLDHENFHSYLFLFVIHLGTKHNTVTATKRILM